MKDIYSIYICKRCRKTIVLITEEVEPISIGKYISCSHCGCKRLVKHGSTDDLRECMKHSRYKRNKHGAIEQID